MSERMGLIHLYTGDGKGKTTCALGLAVRAAGYGYRSFIGQFMKGQKYGEIFSLKKLFPLVVIEQFGLKEFVHPEKPRKIDFEMAKKGLSRMEEVLISGIYKIVVFDEINVTVHFGLLKSEEVIDVIKKKPAETEIILTGRYAPPEFYEIADLISEVRKVKHYFDKGIMARKGIEY